MERLVKTRGGDVIQYYHRIVAATLVCGGTRFLVDCELQRPGEDEVGAAMRLLERVLADYSRAFDIVVADNLYLRPAFFQAVLNRGKDVIATLKGERRDLFKDALALFGEMQPIHHVEGNTTSKWWDIEGFTTWPQLGRPVRVVRSVETKRIRRQIDRKIDEQTSEWIWVTTLSSRRASTEAVVRFGHARWAIENEGGFNELVNLWHANHVYKHAPTAILAFWLLTMLAYNLFHAFLELNVKPVLRVRHTDLHWAMLITSHFYVGPILRAAPP
jgi:hypothetical protein